MKTQINCYFAHAWDSETHPDLADKKNDYEQYLENQKQIDKLFYDRLDSSSAAKGDPQFAGVWVAMTEEDKPIEDYETALHAIYEKCPISRKLTDKQLISALSKQRTGLKKLSAIPLFQKSK